MKKIIFILISIISFSINCAELNNENNIAQLIIYKLTTYTQIQLFLSEVGKSKMESKEITINDLINTENSTLFDLKFNLNQYEVIMSEIEKEISDFKEKSENSDELNYHNEYNYYQICQKNWAKYYQQLNDLFKKNQAKWNNESNAVKYLLNLLKIRTPLHRMTSQDYIQNLKNSNSNDKYFYFVSNNKSLELEI